MSTSINAQDISSPSMSRTMSIAPAATSMNSTQIIAAQTKDQLALDVEMPKYLLLSFGAILLLCVLLAHPQFLARLFASIQRPKQVTKPRMDYAVGASFSEAQLPATSRVVGGGGLFSGWILQSEKKDSAGWTEKPQNPFQDPSTPVSPVYFPPPHITPLIRYLPFSSILSWAPLSRLPFPWRSSTTLARIYVIATYFTLIAFTLVWKSDYSPTTPTKGYGNNFMRPGFIAVAQIPILIALGVRGNLLGLCLGIGYEKLKVFHKIVGRVVFVCTTMHIAYWMKKWDSAGQFAKIIAKPFAIAGLLSYCAMVLIVITSLPWVRKTCYVIFEISHFIGMIAMLAGLAFHVDVAVPYCIAAIVIYTLSIISSLTKTRLAHAELVAIPGGSSTTVITIPTIKSGWRAGQHVRIRIPAVGFPHAFESHPFSIASAPDTEGLVLMCKKAGDWTARLYDLASKSSESECNTAGCTASVIIEGPYGGLGNTLLPSFSSVLLVAGGSGISYALSLAHDLITRAPSGVVRAKIVDLVWIVRTEDIARAFIPTLQDVINDARSWEMRCLENRKQKGNQARPTALRIKIYISRPITSPINILSENPFENPEYTLTGHPGANLKRQPSEADKEKFEYLSRNPSSASSAGFSFRTSKALSGITVSPGKPDLPITVESLVEETISWHSSRRMESSGVCVTACGPSGLVADVRSAVRSISEDKCRDVGGVEYEEESFGF